MRSHNYKNVVVVMNDIQMSYEKRTEFRHWSRAKSGFRGSGTKFVVKLVLLATVFEDFKLVARHGNFNEMQKFIFLRLLSFE